MSTVRWTCAALALLASPAGAADAAPRPRAALLDFTGSEPRLAQSLQPLLAAELARASELDIIRHEEVGTLLGLERQKQLLGCAESTCLSDVGGLLEARFVISGSITRAGQSLVTSVQLLDAAHAQVVNRVVLKSATA